MGNVIGIVAEYNPFHNGHTRLIEQTRARLGADCPVVCVMSGDFVQRGSPAVYSKFARAEAAARCGRIWCWSYRCHGRCRRRKGLPAVLWDCWAASAW